MAFDLDKLVSFAGQGKRGSSYQTFGYVATDPKAEVIASDYFNELKGKASINDTITVLNNSGDDEGKSYLLKVISININGVVEVEDISWHGVISGDVDFNGHGATNVGYIDFILTATIAHQEGRLHWNGDDGTLELGMPGGNVNLQIGQENLIRATNDEGDDIINGQAVYVSGASGANPEIMLADKDSLTTASVIGVVTENITDNQKGYVTTFGYVRDMDTSGISEGAIAWLGDDGNLTGTRPTSPDIQVGVGIVMREHADEGVLFVNPYITPRLQGLSDVFITPVDGDLLKWNGGTARFEAYNVGITKEPTGFVEPKDVIITGNGDETVTLTGTVNAYYEGVKSTTIINGWTSPAHGTDINDSYFLMDNGTTIDWVLESSGFGEDIYSNLLICFAFYDPTNATWVYLREPHGLMPWQSHRENHKVNGTFRDSGGSLADYVLDSTTAADRRPSISACLLYDEDLPTENNALPTGTYTNFYINGADADVNFVTGQADIIPLSTNQPYWNEFTGGAWQQTLMSNNYYSYSFVIAIPMCEDSDSQDLRYIHVQGQHQDNSLSNIQAITTNDVSLGKFSLLLPEFIGITKVIHQYTAGNWKLIEVTDLTGTSSSQVSSPAGNFLTSVTSDATLSGLGTASSPLGVVPTLTTKGDLLGFTTVKARLGVGTDDQVLTADSTAPTGFAWKAGGGSFTRDVLFTGSAGVSTINLSQDINDYNFLEITGYVSSSSLVNSRVITVETFKETSSSFKEDIRFTTATVDRAVVFYYATDTSITISTAASATLTKVVGVK